MEILRDNGTYVQWSPVTDLLCSGCLEPLSPSGITDINFMFDLSTDALAAGNYWYLHKRCTQLEDILLDRGAKIAWGWYPLAYVLGKDGPMQRTFGNLSRQLQKHMPPGVYAQICHQWFSPAPQRSPSPETPRQDRPGVVYLVQAAGTHRIKIGRSSSAPLRLEALQTASPYPLQMLRLIQSPDAVALEALLHRRYASYRRYREWFELPAGVLAALLQEEFS